MTRTRCKECGQLYDPDSMPHRIEREVADAWRLFGRPISWRDLREATGSAPEATFSRALSSLRDRGVIEKVGDDGWRPKQAEPDASDSEVYRDQRLARVYLSVMDTVERAGSVGVPVVMIRELILAEVGPGSHVDGIMRRMAAAGVETEGGMLVSTGPAVAGAE